MARALAPVLAIALAALPGAGNAQEAAAAPAPAAAPQGQFLLRGNLGIDVIGAGLALGAGVGYRPLGTSMEYIVDVFRSGYSESYSDAGWNYDYEEALTILAARAQRIFGAGAEGRGGYTMAGAGFFVAGLSWEEKGTLSYDPTIRSSDGDDYTASGAIFSFGLGYSLTERVDARVEVPIMVFFGDRGQGGAVAIPINASLAFRL